MFSTRISTKKTATIAKTTMTQSSLLTLKDDMVAFIAGHGLRRIPAHIGDEAPTVLWDDEDNADSWKDFVETAKAAGAVFLTMSEARLEKADLELLIEELQESNYADDDAPELDDAQSLAAYVGKVGYIQLGFAHQGILFLHETATPWYDRYQNLVESIDFFNPADFHDLPGEDEN